MHEVVRKHCMDYLVSSPCPLAVFLQIIICSGSPKLLVLDLNRPKTVLFFLFISDEKCRLLLQLCDGRLHHVHKQEEEKQLPRQPHWDAGNGGDVQSTSGSLPTRHRCGAYAQAFTPTHFTPTHPVRCIKEMYLAATAATLAKSAHFCHLCTT